MKVTIEQDRCRGHGVCWTICPDVFDLNDDGYAEVRTPDVPGEFEDAVHSAAVNCPESAIAVT